MNDSEILEEKRQKLINTITDICEAAVKTIQDPSTISEDHKKAIISGLLQTPLILNDYTSRILNLIIRITNELNVDANELILNEENRDV